MGKLLMGIGNGEGDLSEAYARAHAACAASPEALAQARRLTAALQAGDPEATAAWRTAREASLVPVREAAARLGARFDLFLGESDAAAGAAALSASLRDSGLARLSDGALVTDGPPGSVPVMLAKSDGAATYAATDLATLAHRAAVLRAERIVYCADKRQSGHFEGVFHAARACGLADGVRLEHAGFGTVNGRDGKPYRTREGGTPRLSDLLDEAVSKARARLQAAGLAGAALEEAAEKVGVGAVKHADLSAPRTRGYAFDPDRMTAFEGRTGPYLQYALARISSISERAGREGSAAPDVSTPASRSLALACLAFPGAVTEAAEALEPSSVAAASFGVAQAFSRFYAADRVLGSGALEDSRLALCEAARATLSEGLRLMGMEECARL